MSDKTDPRLAAVDGNVMDYWPFAQSEDFLEAIDAADRAAGIVRVDTRDEALVERLAPMLHPNGAYSATRWAALDSDYQYPGRAAARAVLAALREES